MTKLLDVSVYIIAEVGSNFRNLEDCLFSIRAAATCGAHAVKFQLFNYAALYGDQQSRLRGGPTPIPEKVNSASIKPDWLPTLKAHADDCGVEFMCTAFSPELVDIVDPYVGVHKIASCENTWPHYLAHVAAKGKPTLMSVGATAEPEIVKALTYIRPAALLYCVAAYPARQTNLEHMRHLRHLGLPLGFSDHSLEVFSLAQQAVIHYGARVVEKHVSFIDGIESPDKPHSLNWTQFKLMCDVLSGRYPYDKHYSWQPEERDIRVQHKRRMIATQLIREGEPLRYGENFGIFRSLSLDFKQGGSSPLLALDIEGRLARHELNCGEAVCVDDVR